jgi:hypothetical protein
MSKNVKVRCNKSNGREQGVILTAEIEEEKNIAILIVLQLLAMTSYEV